MKVPEKKISVAVNNSLTILYNKPLTEGRIALLEQFYEQTLSYTYHRYGNLGIRGVQSEKSEGIQH